MKSQNTKSSDELEKEVRHEIHNIRKNLDEISGRMSPGQLIDDVIFYPHGRSPGATFEHLKRNPIGTTFLSLGTILLMEDENHQTLEARSRDQLQKAREKMQMGPSRKELALDKINEIKDKYDEMKAEAEYKVAEARDKIDSAKESMNHVVDSVRSEASGLGEKIPELPDSLKTASLKNRVNEKVSGLVNQSRQKFHDLDSVTFMALGAGLGVITGASLPLSEAEKNLVDNKFQDKLSGFSGDLQSAINECSNILKDLVISDVKDFKVNLF